MKNLNEMKKNAGKAEKLLKAVGSKTRLLILCKLAEGEKSVSEILEILKISQSALSQHLLMLKKKKILSSRKEGTKVLYSISDEKIMKLMQLLYEFYCK